MSSCFFLHPREKVTWNLKIGAPGKKSRNPFKKHAKHTMFQRFHVDNSTHFPGSWQLPPPEVPNRNLLKRGQVRSKRYSKACCSLRHLGKLGRGKTNRLEVIFQSTLPCVNVWISKYKYKYKYKGTYIHMYICVYL